MQFVSLLCLLLVVGEGAAMAGSQVTRRGRKSIHREHQKEEGKHEEAEEEGERLRSR